MAMAAAAADELCVICGVCDRDELDAAGSLGTLDGCEHWFCADCILPWLTTRSSTCPVCRQEATALSVLEDGREVRATPPLPLNARFVLSSRVARSLLRGVVVSFLFPPRTWRPRPFSCPLLL